MAQNNLSPLFLTDLFTVVFIRFRIVSLRRHYTQTRSPGHWGSRSKVKQRACITQRSWGSTTRSTEGHFIDKLLTTRTITSKLCSHIHTPSCRAAIHPATGKVTVGLTSHWP